MFRSPTSVLLLLLLLLLQFLRFRSRHPKPL
jgi:hypothetical protein